ncbi:beta-ketoacyl-[acyl-carrier-protein] synthase family protein [Mucilaginibacter sp. X4EP1]|uniref:beta-ketoacyl-[acyl-carrier-protein] synthase family protein n=1 Tax=Mucilaginibacter sp. X4EP1 TaxID=2723092 RepID=UPI002168806B|nr:beta-ketoacyl synthase N-terminal-like domain-containing protein [Mucilaginibacter sp. X4EP1]MCS3815812.1 3-oxoacyl-[acyl-carrier-protein] synthase-1 [Mucilaginibacter sp. X4EP1]
MAAVYVVADNIFSPLGKTTAENFSQLKAGGSGVKEQTDPQIADQRFYASLFSKTSFSDKSAHTKFEQLLIASIEEALSNSGVNPRDKKIVLILSSTKGNIGLLETNSFSVDLKKRIALNTSATLIAEYFGFVNSPIVISNACISGIMGVTTGMRLIQSGQYENIVVAGADVITKFILSGFQSFQAISQTRCKPFDIDRDGINLGEGAATMILSSKLNNSGNIQVTGGAVSNDANHISAPSRTGAELAHAIESTLQQANLSATDIDFVSAHGTATIYNDEMEAKAINLSNLQNVPSNSLKGYYGHTLGAAGLIESIISIQSLKENIIIPTLGFKAIGVSTPINIATELISSKKLTNCLKTASGFGGCNAAVAFRKY